MQNTDLNAKIYDSQHQFVSNYGQDLMSWLPIQKDITVVDLGCGTGHLSQLMTNLGAQVIGIDASAQMIDLAKQNYPNIHFEIQDATTFTLEDPVDAVFSNATLHWIQNQQAVLNCVTKNLKTNGYFVLEMGAKDNVLAIRNAIQNVLTSENIPFNAQYWYYPSIGTYIKLLEENGFEIKQAALFDRPTQLIGNHGMKNWIDQFAHFYFEGLELSYKNTLIDKVCDQLRPNFFQEDYWIADYKRLRIQAVKV